SLWRTPNCTWGEWASASYSAGSSHHWLPSMSRPCSLGHDAASLAAWPAAQRSDTRLPLKGSSTSCTVVARGVGAVMTASPFYALTGGPGLSKLDFIQYPI